MCLWAYGVLKTSPSNKPWCLETKNLFETYLEELIIRTLEPNRVLYSSSEGRTGIVWCPVNTTTTKLHYCRCQSILGRHLIRRLQPDINWLRWGHLCSCVFFPLVREITLPVTSGSLSDGGCWCCLRLLCSKKIKEYLAVYRIAHYAKRDRVPSLDISSTFNISSLTPPHSTFNISS